MPDDVFDPHPIVRLLKKPATDFTCGDLVQAVEQPSSCAESADALESERAAFEADDDSPVS
jgi:hypothetical protein